MTPKAAPLLTLLVLLLQGCGATPTPEAPGSDSSAADTDQVEAGESDTPVTDNGGDTPASTSGHADVTAVESSGGPGAYNFSVTLSSPDTGCEQYADWWEVLSEDGSLIYRRILGHSHVDEQPFTRSGGPAEIQANARVFIRAHMFNSGYGGVVLAGTVDDGFAPDQSLPATADALGSADPQPTGCAF